MARVDSAACRLRQEGLVVKALYNNRLCNIVDMSSDVTLADAGTQFVVSLGDEGLVIDPTDKEVADADNLREWFGLDAEGLKNLRNMLRADLSGSNGG